MAGIHRLASHRLGKPDGVLWRYFSGDRGSHLCWRLLCSGGAVILLGMPWARTETHGSLPLTATGATPDLGHEIGQPEEDRNRTGVEKSTKDPVLFPCPGACLSASKVEVIMARLNND